MQIIDIPLRCLLFATHGDATCTKTKGNRETRFDVMSSPSFPKVITID